MNSLRLVFRTLSKSPGYTAAVILTLALGIGSATAIFTVADRVLFRRPPYPAPEQLVEFGYMTKRFGFMGTRLPVEVAAYRASARSLASYAAIELSEVNFVDGDTPMGVSLGRVSLDYFTTLGAHPLHGRTFLPGEDQPGAGNVIVLTHRFWKTRYSGDLAVLNRAVMVNGEMCRIVGILAPEFTAPGLHAVEIYRPYDVRLDPAKPFATFMLVIGRLQPGVTIAQAQAELAGIDVPARLPAVMVAERKPVLKSIGERMRSKAPTSYWALLGAVSFLYAIACANAGNLMLARLHGRRKELTIRLALGGSPRQVAAIVLIENLALCTAAGVLGLVVAQWIFPTMLRLMPGRVPVWATASVDWRAALFAAGATILAAISVSLVPVLRLGRSNAYDGLSEGTHTVGENRRLRAVRSSLVIIEAALAVTLLVGAGLMVRTVDKLQQIDRGFDPDNKVSVWLQMPGTNYAPLDKRRVFFEAVEQKMRRIPGVTGVGITNVVPLAGSSSGRVTKSDGSEIKCGMSAVTPGYAQMLGLRLLKGRWFDDATAGSTPVVVLGETMAREYFGDVDPLGKMFFLSPDTKEAGWQVVGIAQDICEYARQRPRPHIYYPYWQSKSGGVFSVLLRVAKTPDAALADAVRRAVFEIDPLIATMAPRLLTDSAAQQFANERYTLTVLKVLSGFALVLAAAGLFAIMAYGVSERMGEFGVRLALGATPRQLFALVLERGLLLVAVGVAAGFGAAWALTRFIRSLLYETSAADPMVYAAAGVLLVAAAALGCWLPARRAMQADVAKLLRAE